MIRLGISASALLVLAGCHVGRASAPTPPLPMRFRTGEPPRTALRAAAEQLRAAGFLITAIDSAGRLRAEREHRPGELEGTLTCRGADTPAMRAGVAPTMIIDLAARQRADGGSELVIVSHVYATYLRLTADPARPPSDRDCSSTGVLERGLAEKLSGQR